MSRKSKAAAELKNTGYQLPKGNADWQAIATAVAQRYDHEYRRDAFELPAEVEAMPVFQDWAAGRLQARIASPFWEVACPKKNQHWLDLGCGLSFLIYPWRDWNAFFWGQEISTVAQEALRSRGPQLNSKLFKGVELGAADQIRAEAQQFDGVVATGWSCYYPFDYWQQVLAEVKRVLKPGGVLVLDVVNPEQALAENWSILETYLGAEVLLPSVNEWKALIKESGGKVGKSFSGELFELMQVRF
ncbi:MAG: class I SAM-dependent methyltransferase [Thermosynechococcaceae cyanobacterium MS004]|nr:class I SAM-dependent methyltransferase [Thermosynechococcaceae cyanobacterium MS004]